MSTDLTKEQFVKVLPAKMRSCVNQALLDQINTTLADPTLHENYRDNILSYTNVMVDGRFKITSYLDAVRYVGFKLMGSTNIEAYVRTFPDRYQAHLLRGTSEKDIASHVTAYSKNKLVFLIMEQTLIPTHILNQDMYQKALNVQAELMVSAKSEKVRTDAANSLLNNLKAPETKKIELDIGVKEDKSIQELRQVTMDLVAQQRSMIASGVSTAQQVAHSEVIQGEAEEIEVP